MYLLIVNYEFPPVGGGASFACLGLARTLVARGHRVDVLTSRLKGQPEVEEIEGIRVHRVRSWRHGDHECGLRGAATFVFFAFLRLRQLIASERYNLVHYFFGLPSGLLSLYTFTKHRIPYIVSLRGSDVPGYDPTDQSLVLMHRLLESVNRRIWNNASSVVANSTALRDLAAAFEPSIAFQMVPNAVTEAAAVTPRAAANGPRVELLCVARLIERKGLGVLLTAMSRLADANVMLHIVGGGREEQQLRRMAHEMAVTSKVTFHGSLPHAQVMRMYCRCDIFVLPTLSESCSMALLEAMSMGLPIITTRAGGNPFLIQDGRNGILVAPGDVGELVRAMEALIHDPARRQSIGTANRTRIANEFTWSINAEQYERIYRQALVTSAPVPLGTAVSTSVTGIDPLQTQLLEFTNDAIIIWEMNGRGILYWNRAAEQLYGYSREEAHGQTTHMLLATQLMGGVNALESHLARFGVWVGELCHASKSGKLIYVEARLAVMSQSNGCWLVLEVNRDVSDRKRAEAESLAMQQQLGVLRNLQKIEPRPEV